MGDSVHNFAMDSLDPKFLLEKVDIVFEGLKCAAKLNVAFGLALKSIEDVRCRCYYAQEKITLLERSMSVATTEDFTNSKNLLSNTGVLELCTRERANTNWKLYKLNNVIIFAALLKGAPMVCKDTVSPDPLLKNLSVKGSTDEENTRKPYQDNLCLFGALALHLHGN